MQGTAGDRVVRVDQELNRAVLAHSLSHDDLSPAHPLAHQPENIVADSLGKLARSLHADARSQRTVTEARMQRMLARNSVARTDTNKSRRTMRSSSAPVGGSSQAGARTNFLVETRTRTRLLGEARSQDQPPRVIGAGVHDTTEKFSDKMDGLSLRIRDRRKRVAATVQELRECEAETQRKFGTIRGGSSAATTFPSAAEGAGSPDSPPGTPPSEGTPPAPDRSFHPRAAQSGILEDSHAAKVLPQAQPLPSSSTHELNHLVASKSLPGRPLDTVLDCMFASVALSAAADPSWMVTEMEALLQRRQQYATQAWRHSEVALVLNAAQQRIQDLEAAVAAQDQVYMIKLSAATRKVSKLEAKLAGSQ